MPKNQLVLIVDDSPTTLNILTSCLEKSHKVKVATSGVECLEMSEQLPQPDLILLDVTMPDMDGYEVCELLKSNPLTASIPIIFVTGLEAEKDEERGFLIGAVDYITKPFSQVIVRARVNTHLTIKLQQDKLNKMAFYDQLTGLYNRHHLMDTADQKVITAKNNGSSLWVLMIDIDHFKMVNDNYGHAIGDQVLQKVANTLQLESSNMDLIARSGGEEFIILFDSCEGEEAVNKSVGLLDAIESLKPNDINITISIGMAKLEAADKDFDGLLKRADDALYEAKNNGRNRIEIA
ncbi:diguanylate cyclase [uncultured Psychromonas sp.]|uniref:diguanylate cyclase n=1 Tax=uncultured Psychromonas sp. TaxID=173974 RepID=UPI00260315D3|nr:diguanylate cyclase [uncultured Psychromonas sp.]